MNAKNNDIDPNKNGNWNGVDISGPPHTVFHHQCFQMVDMLIAYAQRSMSGLNPHAAPHGPNQQETEINLGNNTPIEKTNTPLSKPYPHKEMNKKQGWKKQSNRKNTKQKTNAKPKVVEDEFESNRFSQLQNMVGDMTEVTQFLCKAVGKIIMKINRKKKKVRKMMLNHTMQMQSIKAH